jgi:NTE family protein
VTDKVIVVFSGGGAKGAAHIGAMQALTEKGVKVSQFVGTSMGSVIGACFAAGLEYDEVLRRVSAITRRDVASYSPGMMLGPFAESLLQAGPFMDTLASLTSVGEFDLLQTPLSVTAVDAESGDLEIFGTGGRAHVGLTDALYASCALPVYYPPARIGDRQYIDGGIRSVFPLDVAAEFEPDLIIGVHVGPTRFTPVDSSSIGARGIIAAHRRAMRIMMSVQVEETIARWQRDPPVPFILVRPVVGNASTFAIDRVVGFVEAGYRAAHRAFSEWEEKQ